jgi:hypothetical protein
VFDFISNVDYNYMFENIEYSFVDIFVLA